MSHLDPVLALPHRVIVGLTILGEARGEPIEGQIAVGCVIRERVADRRWPNDYRGVCVQPKQFSCWNEHDPTFHAVLRAAEQAKAGQHGPIMRQCLWIADGIIGGALLDNVRGANHYHADTISTPGWAASMIITVKKGHHIFYRAA